jgi:hypothetical protein
MAEIHRITDFLCAVFSTWVVLVGGPLVTIIGLGERYFRKEIHWRFYIKLLFGLLLISFYMSWRDMKLAMEAKPPSLPEFTINERDPKARADVASAQAELADTKKKLEQANEELAKFRDRSFNEQTKQQLIDALKYVAKGTVIVKADWTDSEAQQFAGEIKDVLRQAGFALLEANTEVVSINRKGVYGCVKDGEHPPAHALPILNALKNLGFEVNATMAPPNMCKLRDYDIKEPRELATDEVIIWVGRK